MIVGKLIAVLILALTVFSRRNHRVASFAEGRVFASHD